MNYEQSNVGTGMVPCKKGCRCDDCTIERLTNELREARAEIERVKPFRAIIEAWYAALANKQEPDDE